eukprot:c15013_g1_i1 orf=252-515(+)
MKSIDPSGRLFTMLPLGTSTTTSTNSAVFIPCSLEFPRKLHVMHEPKTFLPDMESIAIAACQCRSWNRRTDATAHTPFYILLYTLPF